MDGCNAEVLGLLLIVVIEVAALSVGGATLDKCPAAPDLPAWLMVGFVEGEHNHTIIIK